MTDNLIKAKLTAAIQQVRADLDDLEKEVPTWISENVGGTRRYRPIADRIVSASQRLKALVTENTYSSR